MQKGTSKVTGAVQKAAGLNKNGGAQKSAVMMNAKQATPMGATGGAAPRRTTPSGGGAAAAMADQLKSKQYELSELYKNKKSQHPKGLVPLNSSSNAGSAMKQKSKRG